MPKPKIKYLIWCAALAMIMACVPGIPTSPPSVPTIDPNAIKTMIVQTGNAASSQTAAALPTNTPTNTFTPTPRSTDTPEPTATSTVIFRFFSPTPIGQVSTSATVATSNQAYACQILSVSPANGTSFAPRTDFDAKWKVKNIGTKNWDAGSLDYVYLSGDKFHKVEGYDVSKAVKVGEIIELIVDMVAPKDNGSYSTNWTLQIGSRKFCTMTLSIVVQ